MERSKEDKGEEKKTKRKGKKTNKKTAGTCALAVEVTELNLTLPSAPLCRRWHFVMGLSERGMALPSQRR
jgi:hypothetical protein